MAIKEVLKWTFEQSRVAGTEVGNDKVARLCPQNQSFGRSLAESTQA